MPLTTDFLVELRDWEMGTASGDEILLSKLFYVKLKMVDPFHLRVSLLFGILFIAMM